jgi:hypothetical protein
MLMGLEMDRVGDFVDAVNALEAGVPAREELRQQFCYVAEYAIGERVHVDRDSSIAFVVTALLWDGGEPDYQLGWFNNGARCQEYFAEWRLSRPHGAGDAEPPRQHHEGPTEQAPIIGFTGRLQR